MTAVVPKQVSRAVKRWERGELSPLIQIGLVKQSEKDVGVEIPQCF